jgi:hypothetical protein
MIKSVFIILSTFVSLTLLMFIIIMRHRDSHKAGVSKWVKSHSVLLFSSTNK